MSGYLKNIVKATFGLTPVPQPLVPSRYAPADSVRAKHVWDGSETRSETTESERFPDPVRSTKTVQPNFEALGQERDFSEPASPRQQPVKNLSGIRNEARDADTIVQPQKYPSQPREYTAGQVTDANDDPESRFSAPAHVASTQPATPETSHRAPDTGIIKEQPLESDQAGQLGRVGQSPYSEDQTREFTPGVGQGMSAPRISIREASKTLGRTEPATDLAPSTGKLQRSLERNPESGFRSSTDPVRRTLEDKPSPQQPIAPRRSGSGLPLVEEPVLQLSAAQGAPGSSKDLSDRAKTNPITLTDRWRAAGREGDSHSQATSTALIPNESQLTRHDHTGMNSHAVEPRPLERVSQGQPSIKVTIGRVEIKAVHPPPIQNQPAKPRSPAISLDDYLRSHNGGRR
ncbi:MAG TPA: hypothetical protein VJX67_14995 [Blastocatellia bacterium]|nr:hypothetical protein [Blastocatellia bacterium]